MANISLLGSIRTCKVDSGWANKLESDRFLNPSLMVCPPWNGFDTAGRPSCWDSFRTKTAGCNSSADRILVENGLRPQYMEYVTLNASGIRGGQQCNQSGVNQDMQCQQSATNATHNITGQYGVDTGFGQNIQANCSTCQMYPDRRAYGETGNGIQEGYKSRRMVVRR